MSAERISTIEDCICPACKGSMEKDSEPCTVCGGTGLLIECCTSHDDDEEHEEPG